ncbi:hypothetical protein LPW11_02595 [Geomonas sp. RF6]|uniref:asparagine synthase-related protein n=1 Tax=Geomonas sp. RF6 TaxID=2897342 RepID=UPI001E45FD07|nr:asparagine synthase-related protein [Geomonas sp. RF6]UFS71087.1 hypothetical protein LPW11_02595 [Geomonas sp. RF6]
MPGIVGIVGKGGSAERGAQLERMLSSMLHEPFYTSASYLDDKIGIYLGWVNRAGAFSDTPIVWNETAQSGLVFYGENFPEEGVPGRLRGEGHRFQAHDRAEYLIHLAEECGDDFLTALNGWFNGVLIDKGRGEAILFNDRYAMQRIYYYESPDALYFASEAKALLKVHPRLRAFDLRSLGEYFSFGCVLENRSLFSNVHLLPPASAWHIAAGEVTRKTCYFSPKTWEGQESLQKEEFYRRFEEKFRDVLPKYLQNGKVALSLTGGLDTRMIMAWLRPAHGELPCYTFGGMYNDCYDVKISRELAALRHQSHRVLPLGRDFFGDFPRLAERTVYLTDGNLDVTGAPELYVNRLAREVAPVRLTGNYGSEILRGARHLKAQPPRPGLFTEELEGEIDLAGETLRMHYQDHPVSFAAFKQAPWLHHNRLSLEQSQITLRSPYLDNDLVQLMYRAPQEVMQSSDLSLHLIRQGDPELSRIMTDRGLGGEQGYLVSKIAYLYREFLFKTDYAFDYGMPQWYAALDHHLLAPLHLERVFLGRHKFYHFRVWYRDELSAYVKEVLLDRKSLQRPYLKKETAERLVLDHTSGRRNYTCDITSLLTMELLQRLMFD